MNCRLFLLCGVALALMLGTYGGLTRLKARQKPGIPGVRMVDVPLLTESNRVARASSVFLPDTVAGYKSEPGLMGEWEVISLPRDTSFGRRRYLSQDRTIAATASVVLMGQDRTSIHRPELCLPGQGWSIQRKQVEKVRIEQPRPYDLRVQRFDVLFNSQGTDGRPLTRGGVYAFWFVADGQLTPSHWTRTAWMMRDLLTRNVLQRWAYVSFFADCAPGAEDATFERLSRLISESVPQFQLVSGAGR